MSLFGGSSTQKPAAAPKPEANWQIISGPGSTMPTSSLGGASFVNAPASRAKPPGWSSNGGLVVGGVTPRGRNMNNFGPQAPVPQGRGSGWSGQASNTQASSNAGSGGGGGGGNVTQGGGGMATNNTNTQANPYLDQVFNRFNDLWGKYDTLSKEEYDPNVDIQNFQKTRAQGLKELNANLGARGMRGGGLAASQLQSYANSTNQGAQEVAASAHDKNLSFQKDLLSGMTGALTGQGGVGQSSAQHQLGLLNANNEATKNLFDNNYRMALLPSEIMRNNMSAMSQILALV